MEYTADDLKGYDAMWDETETNDGNEYENVPPGTYVCRVERAEIRHNKYRDCPELSLALVIESGDWKGQWLWHQNTFEPERIGYLKTTCARLKVNHKPSELVDHLNEFLDVFCEVAVKHKQGKDKTFVNTYINRRVDQPNAVSTVGGPDEELPF